LASENFSVKIGVIGAGAFGTALAAAFARLQNKVTLWARSPAVVEDISKNHRNPKYAGNTLLPENITATEDFAGLCQKNDFLIYACPSTQIKSIFEKIAALYPTPTKGSSATQRPLPPIVNTAKGFDLESLRLHHDLAGEIFGRPYVTHSFLCLSGPSFAAEILRDEPTCVTLSGMDWQRVNEIQGHLSGGNFRLYSNTDIIGCELGGAVKNVIAIAAGICEGLGLGHNTQAALINLGLAEIVRLGAAMGARTETFLGLSGMGDLVLTATSPLSRNRSFGVLLGQGLSMDAAKARIQSTIEGITASDAVFRLVEKNQVRAPICQQVYKILHTGHMAKEAITELLAQAPGGEWL